MFALRYHRSLFNLNAGCMLACSDFSFACCIFIHVESSSLIILIAPSTIMNIIQCILRFLLPKHGSIDGRCCWTIFPSCFQWYSNAVGVWNLPLIFQWNEEKKPRPPHERLLWSEWNLTNEFYMLDLRLHTKAVSINAWIYARSAHPTHISDVRKITNRKTLMVSLQAPTNDVVIANGLLLFCFSVFLAK